jgi:hypothetical protein
VIANDLSGFGCLYLGRPAKAPNGRLWLAAATRRLGLLAFAGLTAIFGLGMTNVAGFYALLASAGPVWAPAIVAAVDFALAVMVVLATRSMKPDPEIERAFDALRMALESIRADVSDLKGSTDAFVQDIRDAKDSIVEFGHDPLDSAVQKPLIPDATSIINGLRAKDEAA